MINKDSLNEARYLFHQGTNFHSYEYLGVNYIKNGDKRLYAFRTWAPNALNVSLLSDFTGWDTPFPMKKSPEGRVSSTLNFLCERNIVWISDSIIFLL